MSNIIQTFPKGSGGGHVVLDTNGTAVDQEKKLQFTGLDVSDDSTNEKTEVKAVGLNADSLDDIIQSASVQGNAVAGNGLVYSTTEQAVGKWIDGKPIYQKTVIRTIPTVTTDGNYVSDNFDISSWKVDKVISIEGSFKYTDNGKLIQITANPYYQTGLGLSYRNNIYDNNLVTASNAIMFNGASTTVTLRYTKTTDT